ncbi:MAG TPA: metal-dependent hydrolase [Chloroflexota bacterium]
MRGVPDLLIGASCGLALSPDRPEVIAAAALGALAPDLDCEDSTLAWIRIVGPIAAKFTVMLAGLISEVCPVRSPRHSPGTMTRASNHLIHRGPIHTPLFAALLFLSTWVSGLDHTVCVALFVGYLSHLLADAPTMTGIAWLWPIYSLSIRLP